MGTTLDLRIILAMFLGTFASVVGFCLVLCHRSRHQNHHCYHYCNVLLNHGGHDHCQRHHGHVLELQVIIFVMFKLSRKTVKQTDSEENFSPPPLSDFQRQSSTSNQSVLRFSKQLDLKLFSQVCGASLPSAGNIFFNDNFSFSDTSLACSST